MKRFVLTFFLLATAGAAVAQVSTFRPGYVLPLTGDTLRGEVDYRGEPGLGRRVRFRTAPDAQATAYLPAELRRFGFTGGEQYLSRTLPGTTAEPVFVQVLASGQLALYRFNRTVDQSVYYAERQTDQQLLLLVQRDTIVSTFNKEEQRVVSVRQRSFPFRYVLRDLMTGCPVALTTLPKLELADGELTKTFSLYNRQCGSAAAPAYISQGRATHWRLTLLAGRHRGSLNYADGGEQRFSSGFGPAFGLGLTLAPGRFNPSLTLHAQALYVREAYEGTYAVPGVGVFVNHSINRQVHLRISDVQLPLFMRYTLLGSRLQPYVQLGPTVTVRLTEDGYRINTPPFQAAPWTSEVTTRSYYIGGHGAVGIAVPLGQIHRLNVEARSTHMMQEPRTSSLQLLAGYTLGR